MTRYPGGPATPLCPNRKSYIANRKSYIVLPLLPLLHLSMYSLLHHIFLV